MSRGKQGPRARSQKSAMAGYEVSHAQLIITAVGHSVASVHRRQPRHNEVWVAYRG